MKFYKLLTVPFILHGIKILVVLKKLQRLAPEINLFRKVEDCSLRNIVRSDYISNEL